MPNPPATSTGQWWTSPATSTTSGATIMVTGRADIDKFRANPRFNIRITVSWPYKAREDGMPHDSDARIMEQATDSLAAVLAADPIAVMTGIYTGDGRRDWVFYTLSTHIFQRKLNEALADLPLLPLEISAETDPDWEEYSEMRQLTEIHID